MSDKLNPYVTHMAAQLCETGRFRQEKLAIQHGTVTVYEHSLRVAGASLRAAELLPCRVDKRALVRGALLHDYFLYDWHEKDASHSLHGFRHPYTALKNAREDFTLSQREENIIVRHMFPLVPIPPACREAWIVCGADKYCALAETLAGIARRLRKLAPGYVH